MSEVRGTEPTEVKSVSGVEKEMFYEELNFTYSERKVKKPWDQKQYNQVLETLKRGNKKSADGVKRSNSEYYYTGKYDIMETDGVSQIILKQKSATDAVTHVVPLEDYFEIIDNFHVSTGHGRRDKIMNALKKNNNIPRFAVETYLKLCSICAARKNSVKQGLFHHLVESNDFTSRGQVDLIDFQSTPDGGYNWVLSYQDLSTKFLHLRPLRTKGATEITDELMKIFLTQGAPSILHSDNGKEFVATVVTELMRLWPTCKIIHGSHRHPESRVSVSERSHQEVEENLKSWMKENNTTKWSMGCYFVQWQRNVSFQRRIGRCPYRALYNRDPKVGLQTTNLPHELLGKITTEDDLKRYVAQASIIDDVVDARNNSHLVKIKHSETELDEHLNENEHDDDFLNLICGVCKEDSPEVHSCDSCDKFVHVTCGREIAEEVEGFGTKLICNSCVSEKYPMFKNGMDDGQAAGAKRMKMSSEPKP